MRSWIETPARGTWVRAESIVAVTANGNEVRLHVAGLGATLLWSGHRSLADAEKAAADLLTDLGYRAQPDPDAEAERAARDGEGDTEPAAADATGEPSDAEPSEAGPADAGTKTRKGAQTK